MKFKPGIDPSLYEAAIVDGATRIQRITRITLPSILPIATTMLILSMGNIMSAGFDQVFNLYSPQVYDVADILDTYVYRKGLVDMSYSFSTAVGLFKSVVGLILVVTVNLITKKISPRYALLPGAGFGVFADAGRNIQPAIIG